ncbi:MAG: hypothetical protein EBT61_03160 [Verrucomicrobia bacterium]|nr:hypothetical protein [Verrucomicrobiota bacterium]
MQEARVLGQLAHPNIVPVHDVGTDEQGRLFYTMKLVVGVTLHDVIGKLKAGDQETLAKYPLNALLTIFQKVCDAVAFAHSRGIIHRDLKPQNIMVGEFGEVLVMDWGLAKLLPGSAAAEEAAKTLPLRGQLGQTGPTGTLPLNSPAAEDQATLVADQSAEADATLVAGSSAADDATMAVGTGNASAHKLTFGSQDPEPARPSGAFATLEGAVMGTPHFMSPEQAEGKIAELDGRSDIFSLGGILYALLTLRPPVEGDSLEEILSKVRSGTIAPPTAFNAPSSTTQAKPRATGAMTEPRKIHPLPHCPEGKVPAALSAVTMKALTRDKAQRYQSVAEFTRDIVAYQGGFATSAENANALTLVRLFIHRHKALTAAASLIVLLTIGFLFKVNAEKRAAQEAAARAAEAERVAKANELRANTTLADLRRTAPVFYTQAQVDFADGKRDAALEKLGYAIQLDEAAADYRLRRAHLRQSAEQLTEAAEDYRRVLALRPTDEAAKANLALCDKLLRESGGAELKRDQKLQLLAALRAQKRVLEAAPLAALLDPDIAATRTAILSRLRDVRKQQGWRDNRVEALPDGTFRIDFGGATMADFSVLKGLPVTVLSFNESPITDLSTLAGLPLRELSFILTKVSDLTPLRGVPLERLVVQGHDHDPRSPLADIAPLRGMKLKSLSLLNTEVGDLSPLAGMPLEELNLWGSTRVRDLTPLAQCKHLERLELRHASVSDLGPLAGLPLTKFSCSGPAITSLAALAGAPLKLLAINETGIRDLSPLSRSAQLEFIEATKTPVSDLKPVAKMPLKWLRLDNTKIVDLSLLTECTSLEEIILPGNVKDVSVLRHLPKLKRLSPVPVGGGGSPVFAPATGYPHPKQTAEDFWREYDARPKPAGK